jgi:hypothetical protein
VGADRSQSHARTAKDVRKPSQKVAHDKYSAIVNLVGPVAYPYNYDDRACLVKSKNQREAVMATEESKQTSTDEEQEERLIRPDELAQMMAVEFPKSRVTLHGNDGEVEFQSIPAPDKVQ